jgi:hypothetical protein
VCVVVVVFHTCVLFRYRVLQTHCVEWWIIHVPWTTIKIGEGHQTTLLDQSVSWQQRGVEEVPNSHVSVLLMLMLMLMCCFVVFVFVVGL